MYRGNHCPLLILFTTQHDRLLEHFGTRCTQYATPSLLYLQVDRDQPSHTLTHARHRVRIVHNTEAFQASEPFHDRRSKEPRSHVDESSARKVRSLRTSSFVAGLAIMTRVRESKQKESILWLLSNAVHFRHAEAFRTTCPKVHRHSRTIKNSSILSIIN